MSQAGLTGTRQQYKDALQYWKAGKIRLEQGHRPQTFHDRQGTDREVALQEHCRRLILKSG